LARIVVIGAGAIGASVAYHLAKLGADDVVLVDRGEIAGGSTAKAMGGVRQQFSTAAEVILARDSIRFFEELGPPYFHQVGYLFLATSEEGLRVLEERRELQAGLGVPVESVDPRQIASLAPGVRVDDVHGGVFCAEDGVADPPSVTRELVRQAVEGGVELREHTSGEDVDADVRVVAAGPYSANVGAALGVELPVRPLCRQLIKTKPVAELAETLPMVLEAETGFHFRRRDEGLVLAMTDPSPRWGFAEEVDQSLVPDRLVRLAHRFPPAAGIGVEEAWAGLYDMTPDAHPIVGRIGEGLYAACGFSGHGFMQSPAVGLAVAEEILRGESSLDLSPYRLERFEGAAVFPEEVVL
jgi:sarcosine oxidase, subunit beta